MTEEILFPPHKGWDPFAPTRTLAPDGPAYRDMQNFRLGDDFLKRRAMVLQPVTLNQPETLPLDPFNQITNEWPIHFLYDAASMGSVAICITNKRVMVIDILETGGVSWYTINPEIENGVGAVWTAGNQTVTGIVPALGAYPILPGDLLTQGQDFVIGVVQSYNPGPNTITLASEAVTSGAGSWEVRKSIQGERAHFRYFNGDLYVACLWELQAQGHPTDARDKWGVYRWNTIRQALLVSPAPASPVNGVWLCANGQFNTTELSNNAAGNVAGIPNNLIDHDTANVVDPGAPLLAKVAGLDLLQDGRVIVPVATPQYDCRVFYSSQIYQPQIHWNTSPGGFVDPVGVSGQIEVMGRLGNQLTLHYSEGIIVGNPTGQDDPPLALQPTRENQGCGQWRTLININPAVETFVGPDFHLYSFNGNSVELLGSQLKPAIEVPVEDFELFSSWDGYNRELSVWRWTFGSPGSTRRVVYSFSEQMWTKDAWEFAITAVSRDYGSLIRASEDQLNDRAQYALVGMLSRDPDELVTTETGYHGMLGFLGELHALEYRPPWVTGDRLPSYVRLDNYGIGNQTVEVDYVRVEVQRALAGTPNDEDVEVEIQFDANPVPAVTRTITLPSASESRVYAFQEFNNNSGEKMRALVSLLGATTGEFHSALGVMRLGVNAVGEVASEGQDVD